MRIWLERDRWVMAGTAAAIAALFLSVQPDESQAPLEPVPDLEIDLNSAPPQVLTILPSVGAAMVAKLLDARAERPFESLDDVDRRVKGVGPRTIELWQPWVRIDAQSPAPPLQKR